MKSSIWIKSGVFFAAFAAWGQSQPNYNAGPADTSQALVQRTPEVQVSQAESSAPLMLARPAPTDAEEVDHAPFLNPHIPPPAAVPPGDPVLQRQMPVKSMPASGQDFAGQGVANPHPGLQYAPPDTNGVVGPNDYVQTVNADLQSVARAVEVARLLSTQGVEELIVGGEEHPDRVRFAGRIDASDAPRWGEREWNEARATLEAVARALRGQFQMRVVVHHHAGTFVETPDEVDRLLAETAPGEVDLLLDTGHCVYGGGDPVEMMRRHGQRVRYVHLKDMRSEDLAAIRSTAAPYRRGVFCSPGEGTVRFGEMVELLRRQRYQGWIIVEHDVVPDDLGRLSPDPFETARQTREYLRRELDL